MPHFWENRKKYFKETINLAKNNKLKKNNVFPKNQFSFIEWREDVKNVQYNNWQRG